MKEKGTNCKPRSEVEVPLKKGTYVWLEPNPPSYSAFVCECHPRSCGVPLWGGNLAVRDSNGAYLSLTCAMHAGITSREELLQSFPALLHKKQGDSEEWGTSLPSAILSEGVQPEVSTCDDVVRAESSPPPVGAPLSGPLLKSGKEQKSKRPRPKLPQAMSPKCKENLAVDALANAPFHVREKLLRRKQDG